MKQGNILDLPAAVVVQLQSVVWTNQKAACSKREQVLGVPRGTSVNPLVAGSWDSPDAPGRGQGNLWGWTAGLAEAAFDHQYRNPPVS